MFADQYLFLWDHVFFEQGTRSTFPVFVDLEHKIHRNEFQEFQAEQGLYNDRRRGSTRWDHWKDFVGKEEEIGQSHLIIIRAHCYEHRSLSGIHFRIPREQSEPFINFKICFLSGSREKISQSDSSKCLIQFFNLLFLQGRRRGSSSFGIKFDKKDV